MIKDEADGILPIDLDIDLEEAVDLDALFDALNIAATDDAGSMDFVATEDGGGVLTVSGQDLNIDTMPSNLDDLNDQSGDLIKNTIVSDES